MSFWDYFNKRKREEDRRRRIREEIDEAIRRHRSEASTWDTPVNENMRILDDVIASTTRSPYPNCDSTKVDWSTYPAWQPSAPSTNCTSPSDSGSSTSDSGSSYSSDSGSCGGDSGGGGGSD